MKSFEEFVKENVEPNHKNVLQFDDEDQESDGKEFDRVIHVDPIKDKKKKEDNK